MSERITVGPASHIQGSSKKNLYGKKSSGKVNLNGGFSGEPTVDFTNITQEQWDTAFPNGYKPWFMREIDASNN